MNIKHTLTVTTVLIAMTAMPASAQTANDVWVTELGSTNPVGSQSRPFMSIKAAVGRTKSWPLSNTVVVSAGEYPQTFTLDPDQFPGPQQVSVTLMAPAGHVVTIGRVENRTSTTLRILALNTHQFGDCIGPPDFAADERLAVLIQNTLAGLNPLPDVILLQEVWDTDEVHLVRAQAAAYYGQPMSLHQLPGGTCFQGGLMMLSPFGFFNIGEEIYTDCQGVLPDPPGECISGKGFIWASIIKDGFTIGVFNTHLEADAPDWDHRYGQVDQLKNALNSWQTANPIGALFAGGDFNTAGITSHASGTPLDESNCGQGFVDGDVFGETCWEYHSQMAPLLSLAAMNDAARNAPSNVQSGTSSFYAPDYALDPVFTASRANDLFLYFNPDLPSELLDYVFYRRRYGSTTTGIHIFPERTFIHQVISPTPFCDDGECTFDQSDHYAVVADFTIYGPMPTP